MRICEIIFGVKVISVDLFIDDQNEDATIAAITVDKGNKFDFFSQHTIECAFIMPPSRCDTCKHKLGILELTCKCGKKFCTAHIQCEMHSCTYDHRKSGQELLRKQLDVGKLSEKLEHRI